MNPKHIDNIPKHRAIAPYNFVELPEKVVEAEPLPDQDCYHEYSEHLINGKTVKIKRHTGTIKCSLTTESPLYTRCGWSPEDFAEHGETAFKDLSDEIQKLRAKFFISPATAQLMIPGSSLRGILRTLVEIVSFSKIEKVTDNKLFYRSIADKKNYTSNFIEESRLPHPHRPSDMISCYASKVHAGFLRKLGNSYVIEECGYGRIHFDINNPPVKSVISTLSHNQIYEITKKLTTPDWKYQHQTIYVDIDTCDQDEFFKLQYKIDKKTNQPKVNHKTGKLELRHSDLYLRFRKVHSASCNPAPGLQKGTLVITGNMQHKHLEFVFLDEKLNVDPYPINDEIMRRFQDDDQVTKWQEKAYPKDKPSSGCREKNGYLRDGEPVFFLLNNDNTVRFFGRAQMFRLPYNNSPLDFVPLRLRFPIFKVLAMYFKMLFSNHKSVEYATLIALFPCFVDIADVIFGFIHKKLNNSKAYASRVFITDGILKQNQREKVQASFDKEPEQILLSNPKPTTFQHYLVQPKETEARQKKLKHYGSQAPTDSEPRETVIRGHKLYWHKEYKKPESPENSDTQTSLVKPIDPGIEFTFDIHFENLSDVELGALLWVLSLSSEKSQTLGTGKPGEKYCFSLGMGKPLGMGAVKIDYELNLSDRTARYNQLFNGDGWSLDKKEQDEVTQAEINCIRQFEKYVLDHISENDYPDNQNRQQPEHLRQVPRIEMLLAMLQCDPPPEATDYMELDKFKDRKVLPTPLDIRVKSKPKPQKKSDRPTQETEAPVNLALQRGLTPAKSKLKPKPKPKPKS